MSELRKANTNATYFITCTIVGWIDVFTRSRYCDEVIDSLHFCKQSKGLDVFAYVIMPSHIHLLARQLDGRLNETIRDFKAHVAKQILHLIESEPGESRKDWLLYMFRYYAKFQQQNSKYQFWQKTNHPIEMLTPEILMQKINYIHNNPVAASLVIDPESWLYSSACSMSPFTVACI
jgi:putative transposase